MSLSFEKGCHFEAKAGSEPPAHLPQPPECCEKHVLGFRVMATVNGTWKDVQLVSHR